MFTNTVSAVTLTIALGLGAPLNPAHAERHAAPIVTGPQIAMTSGRDVERLILRLRGMRGLPEVLLDWAEKAYRVYKLNGLDHELQAVREITARTLRELERLARNIEQGETRLAKLEQSVQRLERSVAELNAHRSTAAAPRKHKLK